jgi:cystathionine gamma-synthase
MTRARGLNTECVHAAHLPDAVTGALAQPIHLSTTFERDADGSYPRGYRYSREGTPNREALEACVAILERGTAAIAFASGLAANMAVLELLRAGDRVLAPLEAYHGTLRQLRTYVRERGVEVHFADFRDPSAVEAGLQQGARLLWIETPANPLLSITDLAAISALGRRAGAWVVCDNTFATPICQRPFDYGVDLVIHSATKYFGGHSDVMGGVVVVREDASLLERLRNWQVLAGAVLAPFDCWLLRRSLATLALRVRAQCASALTLAQFLADHDDVERVFYPGLPRHPGHALALAQMPGGFGAVLSFCVRGGRDAALDTAARTRLLRRATSLGGVESLIEHRASIEGPGSLTPQNLLRVSIGIEDSADLIEDLSQALA